MTLSQKQDALAAGIVQAQARIRTIVSGRADGSAKPEQSRTGGDEAPPASAAGLAAALEGLGRIPSAILIGALSGAVMAVVTYFVLAEVRPPQDPRLPALAGRVSSAEQGAEAQGRLLHAAETDLARLADANRTAGLRIDQQASRIDAMVAELEATRANLRAFAGTRSPVFGMAIAQLRQAIETGRPFETEWVNAHALSADDPTLQAALGLLHASSLTGLETPTQLRAELVVLTRERGIPNRATIDPLEYSLIALQTKLGISLGYTPAELAAGDLLGSADRHLALGDVAQALAAVARVPAPYAEPLAPWTERARRRENVLKMVKMLATTSRDQLQATTRAPTH